MLLITLTYKNKLLAEAFNIHITEIEPDTEKYRVSLHLTNAAHALDVSIGKRLTLIVQMKNRNGAMFILNTATVTIDRIERTAKSDVIDLFCDLQVRDDYYAYDQDLLDHIRHYWQPEEMESIDRSQFTEEEHCLYMRALLFWHGVPDKLDLQSKYCLEGNKVKNKCDLFICLGELFIGERGYIGNNLDALHECLFETVKTKTAILFEIKSARALKEKIGEQYLMKLKGVLDRFFEVQLLE